MNRQSNGEERSVERLLIFYIVNEIIKWNVDMITFPDMPHLTTGHT